MLRISKELVQGRTNTNGLPTKKLLMQLLDKVALIRAGYLILEAIMTHMECPIEKSLLLVGLVFNGGHKE
jgi:hypothetical protein